MLEPIVLRARWLVAICGLAAFGCLVAFGALALSGPGPDPEAADSIGAAVLGIAFALPFARATRMRVELDDRGVTVFRIFTTELVPWIHLVDASVDYGGLRLMRTDGDVVTVGSMGKPNWATWLHRRVAADDRVDVIRCEMVKHRPNNTK